MSVKIFTIIAVCTLSLHLFSSEKQWRIVNTDSADLAFRKILIDKNMRGETVSCVVTRDKFDSAVKKLQSHQADIVLVKGSAKSFNKLPPELAVKEFANTLLICFVNKNNPVSKLKLSDLRKIWNSDYTSWNLIDSKNPYSIHRYGMPINDSVFLFISKQLQLNSTSQHLPLDSSQQIITMTAANPHAIGIAVFEPDLNFNGIKLIQLTDDNGKNINWQMPHTAIFHKSSAAEAEKFLTSGKE